MARKPATDAETAGGSTAGGAAGQSASPQVAPAVPNKGAEVLRVLGPSTGRRRAGRHFGSEAVDIPLDELTEEEIAALRSDPLLIVALGVSLRPPETAATE